MSHARRLSIFFVLGAILACGHPAGGQTPPAGQPAPAGDAKAILEKSAQFTRSLKTVSGDMVSTVTTAKGPMATRMMIWAEMPDKLATRSEFPGGAMVAYLVGNTQTTYIQKKNMYSVKQLPEGAVASQLQGIFGAGLEGNGQLADKSGGGQMTLVGKENVSGVSCNHLRGAMADGSSVDLWIADGAQPLPLYARMKMVQPPMSSDTAFRWSVNQPIPAAYFQFTPPPGAVNMDTVAGAPRGTKPAKAR